MKEQIWTVLGNGHNGTLRESEAGAPDSESLYCQPSVPPPSGRAFTRGGACGDYLKTENELQPELSPCKCGAEITNEKDVRFNLNTCQVVIICPKCKRQSDPRKTERGAINAWNRMNIPNQSWGKR